MVCRPPPRSRTTSPTRTMTHSSLLMRRLRPWTLAKAMQTRRQELQRSNGRPRSLVAERVQIQKNATGKQQKPWIGYEGTVVAQIGPESVDVSIVRAPRCKPIRVAFHISEVEVIQ